MAIYHYFKKAEGQLPDPKGPLSKEVPSSSISIVNDQVKAVIGQQTGAIKKRGPYTRLTSEEKAQIGRKALENGVAATIRYFAQTFPGLKESSIQTWRDTYKSEIKKRRRCGEDIVTISELREKKKGRPLLLGEELDQQVKAYLTSFREHGAVINTAIIIACAEGIVKSKDSNLLACNGGNISLTKDWAKSLMQRMGLVKRRPSTKAKLNVEYFEVVKLQFLIDIKTVVEMDEIPFDLIINWDQTGINYVPVSSWTMEKQGAKRVEIVGVDDKWQITAVFSCSMSGDFLPMQVIYKGTTSRCLPSYTFPSDWHITHSTNHWSNDTTMQGYIEKLLLPYIKNKRKELQLEPDYPALVIFDVFKGQCTEKLFKILEDDHVSVVLVHPNCTDRLYN